MDMNVRLISFTSTVSTLNAEGTQDSFQANANYKIVGGSIAIYDADGAVLQTAPHDEITIALKWDDTDFNPRNLTLSAWTLHDLMMREVFPDVMLESGKTIYFKAKHISPATTVQNAVPIKVVMTLNAVKVSA